MINIKIKILAITVLFYRTQNQNLVVGRSSRGVAILEFKGEFVTRIYGIVWIQEVAGSVCIYIVDPQQNQMTRRVVLRRVRGGSNFNNMAATKTMGMRVRRETFSMLGYFSSSTPLFSPSFQSSPLHALTYLLLRRQHKNTL